MIVLRDRNRDTVAAGRSTTDVDADLLAWRSRREQLGRELDDARGRKAELDAKRGDDVGALMPDERAINSSRKASLAVATEIEDLEAGIVSVDARLGELQAERVKTARRQQALAARAQHDHLKAVAAREDEVAGPFRAWLEELLLAHQDTATSLGRLYTGIHARSGESLTRVLFWRVSDLLEGLPRPIGASERVSIAEYLSFPTTRARLEAELAGEEMNP